MTEGGKVARRKAFADEGLEPNARAAPNDPKKTIYGRDDKQDDQGGGIHSRTSSCSTLPVVDPRSDTREGAGQSMGSMGSMGGDGKDASGSPDESKLYKAKVHGVPINFGTVASGVYRSGYPQADDYVYLKSLRLRTILTLVKKEVPEGYQTFMRTNGIRHIVIGMQGTEKVAITREMMNSIAEVVLDQRNYPILIHCNHGRHRTGCAVAVVRKLLGWNIESIIEEYSNFAEPKIRQADIQYIQNVEVNHFDVFLNNNRCVSGASLTRSGTILELRRMAKFMLLVAFTLGIWSITAVCIRF